jgi:hypothetical protein
MVWAMLAIPLLSIAQFGAREGAPLQLQGSTKGSARSEVVLLSQSSPSDKMWSTVRTSVPDHSMRNHNIHEAIDISVIIPVKDIEVEIDSLLRSLSSLHCKELSIEVLLHIDKLDTLGVATKRLLDALDRKDTIIAAVEIAPAKLVAMARGHKKIVLQSSNDAPACSALTRSLPQPASLHRALQIPKQQLALSFLIQFWGKQTGHEANVKEIVQKIHGCGEKLNLSTQVLANVDSRTHKYGHLPIWLNAIRRSSDVLLLSDNVHELRGYNKLANLAQGGIMFMMQDDSLPPDESCAWISRSADVLQSHHSTVAAVSIKNGLFSIGYELDVADSFEDAFRQPRCYDPVTKTHLEAIRCVDVGPLVRCDKTLACLL